MDSGNSKHWLTDFVADIKKKKNITVVLETEKN